MTPVELSRTVLHAVRRAVDDGELNVSVPAHAVVTPPGPGGRGDYATNIALQLARPAGRAPLDVAEILRPRIRDTAGVSDVEITGPGFLNIHLERATAALVRDILDRRDSTHGSAQDGSGQEGSGRDGCHRKDGRNRNDGISGTPKGINSNIGSSDTNRPTPHPPYGHTATLAGQVIPLRVPYDIRAEVVADALVRIIATQGGRAEVDHVRPGDPVDLRPVPAPEDPAPLGPDAARWALLYPAAHDRPRITADLLLQRESNPLFRVRYAHARVRALCRNAARLGFDAVPGGLGTDAIPRDLGTNTAPGALEPNTAPGAPSFDTTLGDLARRRAPGFDTAPGAPGTDTTPCASGPNAAPGAHPGTPGPSTTPGAPGPHATPDAPGPNTTPDLPGAAPVLRALAEYPNALTQAAVHRAPDRLARHLVVVADALLAFQHTVLPLGDEKPSAAHRARLALAEAAGTVLAGGLSLLGISAPDYL